MTAKRTIIVVDYDPIWKITFDELRTILLKTLVELTVTIEHVGSTSVPNLAAKPIIDLNVVIPSLNDLPKTIELLNPLGYYYEGDLGVKGREAFGRNGEDVPRDGSGRIWHNHYLYVCPEDGIELNRQLLFRDYLRAHPDRAEEYGRLKRELSARFRHDIISYTDGKKDFVEEIIELARQSI